MEKVALLFAAIVPAFVLLAYGRAKTQTDWSNEALWTAFMLGCVGAIAAIVVELIPHYLVQSANWPPVAQAAGRAVFVAAIPEEAIKFLVLVGVVERHVDLRRVQDIVMMALAVSLGFAAVENIFYVAKSGDWQGLAMERAMTAVLGHGLFGIVMGALLAWARIWPDRSRFWLAAALIVPVIMHAAYNFPLLAATQQPWLGWEWLWTGTFVCSAVLAIAICNWVLPMAAEADRLAGHEKPRPDTGYLIGCVFAFVLVAALFVAAPYLMPWRPSLSQGSMLGFLPLLFGLDLVRLMVLRRWAQASARLPTR